MISPFVEVEIVGTDYDANKYKTNAIRKSIKIFNINIKLC
jgi:hypothetical protein